MIRSYKDLEVYKQSYDLSLEIHKLSLNLPRVETYVIGDQLRRAAVSIPLNIAEGYGKKKSVAEFKHYLANSMGSCNEVSVLLDMCFDLGFFTKEIYVKLSKEYDTLGRRINKLMQAWQ